MARDCQDADFCTVEECSETLKTCVRADYHDVEACRETCFTSRLPHGVLPLLGQCGKLMDTEATLCSRTTRSGVRGRSGERVLDDPALRGVR